MYEVYVENRGCVHAHRDTREEAFELANWYRDTRGEDAWVFLDGDLVYEAETARDGALFELMGD